MKINELKPEGEVAEIEGTVKAIVICLKPDPKYGKTLMVREYFITDETGEVKLTTFSRDLFKKPNDKIKIQRAWCKLDKFYNVPTLTLGKWGKVI